MPDFGYDSTTGRAETLDDWLAQWREQGGWQAKKAEVNRLIDCLVEVRKALDAGDRLLRRDNDALRAEIGRLRTMVRIQEVALADWEKSYPEVATDA